MKKIALIIFAACLISGCSNLGLYQSKFQQGNLVQPEKAHQLRVGMSKMEVLQLMGTPLLDNPFSDNRWDYVYTYQKNYRIVTRRHVMVRFEHDRLVDFTLSPSVQES